MPWFTLDDAAARLGCSRRTVERRVAADQLAAYTDPTGARQVHLPPEGTEEAPPAWALALLEEVRSLRKQLAERPAVATRRGEVLRVASGPDRPTQATRTRRVAPAPAASPSASSGEPWRAAWAFLVGQHPTVTAAGKAAGLSQPQASRLHRGKRRPRAATAERIVAAARAAGWSSAAA